ncbi:unnamed protein product, partial [Aphanomyces euteiches]
MRVLIFLALAASAIVAVRESPVMGTREKVVKNSDNVRILFDRYGPDHPRHPLPRPPRQHGPQHRQP